MTVAQAALRLLYRLPLVFLALVLEGICELTYALARELRAVIALDNGDAARRKRAKSVRYRMSESIVRDIERL